MPIVVLPGAMAYVTHFHANQSCCCLWSLFLVPNKYCSVVASVSGPYKYCSVVASVSGP